MGVKPIFKIETEDGKTIRTTGNHPYLAKQESTFINSSSEINDGNIKDVSLTEKFYSDVSETESMSGWRQINQGLGKNQRIGDGKIVVDFPANFISQYGSKFFKFVKGFISQDELMSHKGDYNGYSLPEEISLRADLYSRFILSRPSLLNGQLLSISSINLPTKLESYSLSGSASNNFSSILQSNSQKAYESNKNQVAFPFLNPTAAWNFFGNGETGINLEKCSTFVPEEITDLALDVLDLDNDFGINSANLNTNRLTNTNHNKTENKLSNSNVEDRSL